MAEHEKTESPSPAAAIAMAAAGDPAMREEVRRYLERQSELAALQIEDLKREDKLRHWSLRVHHISELLKLGFELAAALVVTALAAFIGAALWNAAHDDGMVIEAFNVPADMAANGLTGQVIATQIQDRLAWMQANTDTIRQASSYRNNFADDIKVQIPDTGVSIGEFTRYLAGWLGHQTHISGEVWRAAGGVSLSVRSGTDTATSFQGSAADLPALVAKAAEHIYWQTQPYRYGAFIYQHGRRAEADTLFHALALHGLSEDRPWAYSRLGISLLETGDARGALRMQKAAAALDPDLPHVWANMAAAEVCFGHDEAALSDERRSLVLLRNPRTARQLAAYAVDADLLTDQAGISDYSGDYRDAITQETLLETKPVYSGSDISARLMMSADLALDHDSAASARADRDTEAAGLAAFATSDFEAFNPPLPVYERAAARGDWRAARDDLVSLLRLPVVHQPEVATILPVWVWPRLALADARLGDVAAALALIDKTPRDCYLCATVRGQIAAAARDWRSAATWYAEAARLGPSFPFADTDWGAMLLAKGDLDGAIGKFENAHRKGPHFADPLEMWGETLIARNRSDLALAKFEEADKYAPAWGRLHLKWGEALWWSGNKGDAQKQFAIAAGLDLSPSEWSELAKVSTHG